MDYDYNSEFKDFIEVNIPSKFAITPINTYRNCPKQYFYDKILKLKVCSGNKDDMSYGSALHLAFEETIKKVMNERKYLTNEEALEVFNSKLKTLEITNPEGAKKSAGVNVFGAGVNKGVSETNAKCFYDDFKALVNPKDIEPGAVYEKSPKTLDSTPTGKYRIYAEVPLDVKVNIDGKQVCLTGYVDRLDKNPDGTYTIYDYKTKENCEDIPPSDNYFYQMAFYKYVLEKQYGITVTKTCFILPIEKNGRHYMDTYYKMITKKQNYGGVEYTCTNYEFSVEEIMNAIKNILNGQFDEAEKPNCSYCGYKYLCKDRKLL